MKKSTSVAVTDAVDHVIEHDRFAELPCFAGNYAVIGSWVIGGDAAGIGIREADGLITTNHSRFVPHRIAEW